MLKYGIELEGGYARHLNFISTRDRLNKEGRDIRIKKDYDGTAGLREEFDTSYYTDEIEFKSSEPITEIEQHIDDWEVLMNELEFVSDPKSCGLHIHTSPTGHWSGKKYQTFVYNLFFLLVPFAKFFKNRQQQSYCLGNGSFYRLVRFFTEEFLTETSKRKMIEKYKNALNSEDRNKRFNARSMIRLTTGKNTVEVRLFPSRVEFIRPLIQIINFAYEQDNFLNASKIMIKNIVEILNLVGAEDSIEDFREYYNEWIK
ncbi:MAG: amidoligase family protein [bacterium]